MTSLRRLITAVILVLVVAAQSTIVARWNLPGTVPDLVLVVVSAFAMRQTASRAVVIGFLTGLLLDATPPGVGLLGVSAFTLSIVAFAAAQLRTDLSRSPFGPLLYVAGAGAASVLVHALIGGLLGEPVIGLADLPIGIFTGGLYCALLGSVVIPLIQVLVRFLMPAPSEYVRR